MVITPEQLIRVLFNEVIAHRVFAVWLFIFISLGMLGAGLVFPKQYVATTTILIDETNIIKPLTEGVYHKAAHRGGGSTYGCQGLCACCRRDC